MQIGRLFQALRFRLHEEEVSYVSSPNLKRIPSGKVKSRARWGILLGIVTAALGLLLIAHPLATAAIATFLLGCILVTVGVLDLVLAVRSHTSGGFFPRLLLGITFCVGGVFLVLFPLSGIAVLTVVLGVMLIFEGGFAAILASQIRPASAWGWLLLDGAVSLVLGFLIIGHWPRSSIWAIGTLVGVAVLMRGITRIALSAGLRRAAATFENDDIPRPRAA